MKRIIDGILYDTNAEGIEEICSYWNGLSQSDFRNISETLYLTPNNNWFIAGTGGAMTHYAEKVGNMTSGSSRIRPISVEEAKKFIADHGSVELYCKYFNVEKA